MLLVTFFDERINSWPAPISGTTCYVSPRAATASGPVVDSSVRCVVGLHRNTFAVVAQIPTPPVAAQFANDLLWRVLVPTVCTTLL